MMRRGERDRWVLVVDKMQRDHERRVLSLYSQIRAERRRAELAEAISAAVCGLVEAATQSCRAALSEPCSGDAQYVAGRILHDLGATL